MARVFVGMSGGVDSSVAAALLLAAGHEVTGITLQMLPEGEEPGQCCGTDAVRDARRVCDALGIAHYTFSARDPFEREVLAPFAAAYAAGLTPNPCVVCNERVKFALLARRALEAGAEIVATGHYARVVDTDTGPRLARGADEAKDQSYFLYRLGAELIGRVILPLGELSKDAVRLQAEQLGLATAHKPDSQDVCFAPTGPLPVLERRAPEALTPGEVVDAEGRVLGTHEGIGRYTVGKRKGLGLGDGPWFVVSIDAPRNRLVVGPRESLAITRVTAIDPVWHDGPGTVRRMVALRHRMAPVPATVTASADRLLIVLDEPVFGVAPGQAAVAWTVDGTVSGGGVVSETA
jgi:tRNA-specific 2-thiouridylase